ncbi:MAG: ABC transporter permease, partial [Myxococcota bacterium]|nr:ABC transporter permease [Myxococcota bacterium]
MFRIDAQPSKSQPSTVRLSGRLEREQVPQARTELLAIVKSARGALELELSEIEALDTAGVALISAIYRHARKRGCTLRLVAASPAVERALSQFHLGDDGKSAPPSSSWLLRLGESAISRWQNFLRFAFLSTDTIVWSLGGARRTRRVRRGAIFQEANRIGVDALGIVGLISFLVGTVVALQSAYQLKQFGADIFVANLIGVSMTREMGPLMTAIIIAGRSGAAIAAEIATMSVNEEIDALRTLGLEPTRYIVVPKFQAITLTMPGLTVMANVLGIFGGFLVAV